MGHIIRVSEDWSDRECNTLINHLEEQGYDDAIVVRDSEMEVFEYDELEDVTVYEDEVAEKLGVDVSEEAKFLNNDSLEHGME